MPRPMPEPPPPTSTPAPAKSRASTGHPALDARIKALLAAVGGPPNEEYVRELIATAIKIARDRPTVADLKLFNRTLKELRHAARVLAPYAHRRKVAVFGSARTPPDSPSYAAAETFGRRIRDAGFMVITGGGDGIMGAAQRGAGREHSFGLNIRLPFEQRANATIAGDPKLIHFNYFFTRKLNFLKETDAVALFPGGFGTMDEGFEVVTLMQTGKARLIPVVLVDHPGSPFWGRWLSFVRDELLGRGLISPEDFALFRQADSPEQAVAEITAFYRNFHSYRWVGERMVIRLRQPLAPATIEALNREFAPILRDGPLRPTAALPEEHAEPDLQDLPRLVLTPDRHEVGPLRLLLDAINRP